jgi:hypothetical protein
MRAPAKIVTAVAIIAAATAIVAVFTFRNRPQPPGNVPPEATSGEPQNYSATVVRIIDDGGAREEVITRVARLGEMRREEWSEQSARRALIWRPDLGKCFLLALDKQQYVETDFARPAVANQQSEATDLETIERALTDAPSPASVEVISLPDQIIDNHPCSVTESRATFSDGHVEITRTFRARDLSGLDIRVESQSTASGIKIITERRDVKTEVSGEEFNVPAGFKKVAVF